MNRIEQFVNATPAADADKRGVGAQTIEAPVLTVAAAAAAFGAGVAAAGALAGAYAAGAAAAG